MKRDKTPKTALCAIATLGAVMCLSLTQAQAQRGGPSGMEGNRPNMQGMNGMNTQGNMQGNMQGGEQQRQQMREQNMRAMLQTSGLNSNAQEIIVAYANAQSAARQPIMEGARQVTQQIMSGQYSDAQLSQVLSNLHTALDTEKTRRQAAEKQLDAQIGYSKTPRLELLLTMMGLIGDSEFLANPGGMGGRGGPGGPGGMGGPPGMNSMNNGQSSANGMDGPGGMMGGRGGMGGPGGMNGRGALNGPMKR